MADDYTPVGYLDDEDQKPWWTEQYPAAVSPAIPGSGAAPGSPAASMAPPVVSAAPPVTSSPAAAPASDYAPVQPTPAPGSTEDLEAHAPKFQYAPVGSPNATPPSWKDYQPAEPHGWSKLGHILARFTPASYDLNIRPQEQARQAYNAATNEWKAGQEEENRQSEEDLRAAQTKEAKERADFLRKGGVKPGVTPEETTIHDLMTGENGQPRINPATNKPYSYLEAYQAVEKSKAEAHPQNTKDEDVADYLAANNLKDTPANREKARGAIAERGKQEPGNFMPLYDDKGHVTGGWDPKSGRVVNAPNLPGTTSAGIGQQNKATAENQKQVQPLQDVLDEIAESREFAQSPSATNDYGLLMNFIGVTKPASLAKLRLNQNEVALAKGTRSTLGDVTALAQKVENGQMLTADQRAEMLKTMDTVEKFTRRRMDTITGGGGAKTQDFTDNGVTYHIPADKVDAFKQAHPNAK